MDYFPLYVSIGADCIKSIQKVQFKNTSWDSHLWSTLLVISGNVTCTQDCSFKRNLPGGCPGMNWDKIHRRDSKIVSHRFPVMERKEVSFDCSR